MKKGVVLLFDKDYVFNSADMLEEKDKVNKIKNDNDVSIPEREVRWLILLDDKEDDVHLKEWSHPESDVFYKLDYSHFERYVDYVQMILKLPDNNDQTVASVLSGKTSTASNSIKYSHPSAQLALLMRSCVPQIDKTSVNYLRTINCFVF